MKDVIDINGNPVGEGQPIFVIAEIGINHSGDVETAKKLIEAAKNSGASAVKLQTYITEKRVAKDSPIFDILKKCELSFDDQGQLFEYAKEIGVEAFSTPFDEDSVEFLSSIGTGCYKIASFDIVNKKLLRQVAEKGKPVIISRGMASAQEVDNAVAIMQEFGTEVALLHCISAYPVSSHTDLNLSTIAALKEKYGCPVGFSDHTTGSEAAHIAVAGGATLIEKHFTLSRDNEAPDNPVSIEPQELKELVENCARIWEMLGEPVTESIKAEEGILQFRRVT